MIEKFSVLWDKITKGNLKFLLNLSKSVRLLLISYILMGFISSLISIFGSIISKNIIDAVLYEKDKIFFIWLIFYGLIQIFEQFIISIRSRLSSHIENITEKELRLSFIRSLLSSYWLDIQKYDTGDLLARVSGDVSSISGSVVRLLPEIVTRVLQLLLVLSVIIASSSSLSLMVFLGIPISVLISLVISRKVKDSNKSLKRSYSNMISFLTECFSNITIIKSFGISESYLKKNQEKIFEYYFKKEEYSLISVKLSFFSSLFGVMVGFIGFSWCIMELWFGRITYGTMVMFLSLFGVAYGSVSSLVYLIPYLISILTSEERVLEVLNLKKEDVKNTIPQKGKYGINFKEASIGYTNPIVKNINIRINPGEVVGLVGETGSGKTTLLRTLLGLVNAIEGRVEFFNEEGYAFDSSCVKDSIAYVPQDNILFNGSIRENLICCSSENVSEEDLITVLKLTCSLDFVNNLKDGLNYEIKGNGENLSEGQIQRLAIARALLCKKPFLLLDEATSALDEGTESVLLHNIKESLEDVTCVVVTHRKSLLGLCDRVFSTENGLLVEKQLQLL